MAEVDDWIRSGRQQTSAFDRVLLPGEAAWILNMTPKTVTRWADRGDLLVTRTPSGHRRFLLRDLLRQLAATNPQRLLEVLVRVVAPDFQHLDVTIACDEVVSRLSVSPDPEARLFMAGALAGKAVRSRALGRTADEVEAYDQLITRFHRHEDTAVGELVGRAEELKAQTLRISR